MSEPLVKNTTATATGVGLGLAASAAYFLKNIENFGYTFKDATVTNPHTRDAQIKIAKEPHSNDFRLRETKFFNNGKMFSVNSKKALTEWPKAIFKHCHGLKIISAITVVATAVVLLVNNFKSITNFFSSKN